MKNFLRTKKNEMYFFPPLFFLCCDVDFLGGKFLVQKRIHKVKKLKKKLFLGHNLTCALEQTRVSLTRGDAEGVGA